MKKYLLFISDATILMGFFIPFLFGCSIIGIVYFIHPEIIHGWWFTCIFVLSIALVIWTAIVRYKNITNVNDFSDSNRAFRKLLKVENGKVIAVGDKFWGKEDVHHVYIPHIWNDRKFQVQTTIGHVIRSVNISVNVELTVHVKEAPEDDKLYGFNPQEIYDYVIKNNDCSIREWLAKEFTTAADTPTIRALFEANADKHPFVLLLALSDELKKTRFEYRFTNITSIDVRMSRDSNVDATFGYN